MSLSKFLAFLPLMPGSWKLVPRTVYICSFSRFKRVFAYCSFWKKFIWCNHFTPRCDDPPWNSEYPYILWSSEVVGKSSKIFYFIQGISQGQHHQHHRQLIHTKHQQNVYERRQRLHAAMSHTEVILDLQHRQQVHLCHRVRSRLRSPIIGCSGKRVLPHRRTGGSTTQRHSERPVSWPGL